MAEEVGLSVGRLTRFAVDNGYYDQVHLIYEFQALAGFSPNVYLRDRAEDSPSDLPVIE